MERKAIIMYLKESGIYQITNTVTGKFYIGSSGHIKNRWKDHKRDLTFGKHTNYLLQQDWNKYGENNFQFSVVEFVAKSEDIIQREQCWIDITQACKNGYNLAAIAGLPVMTPESRKRQSYTLKKNTAFIEKSRQFLIEQHKNPDFMKLQKAGVLKSDKVKQQLQQLNQSEKHKQQVKQLLENLHNDTENMKRVANMASKNRLNASWREKHGVKPIVQIDMYTNEPLYVYATLGEVNMYGFERTCVSNVCKGKAKQHKGYYWEYLVRVPIITQKER